jgi:hypothetical protein
VLAQPNECAFFCDGKSVWNIQNLLLVLARFSCIVKLEEGKENGKSTKSRLDKQAQESSDGICHRKSRTALAKHKTVSIAETLQHWRSGKLPVHVNCDTIMPTDNSAPGGNAITGRQHGRS